MWQTQTLAQLKGPIPKTQKIYHVIQQKAHHYKHTKICHTK